MHDTTIKKVDSRTSPRGPMGEQYLVSGKSVSLRRWSEPSGSSGPETVRSYETVGYVLRGRARLHSEGQQVELAAGHAWLVPAGARHSYEILEEFEAIEATSPPAQVHGRDRPPHGG